jgi:hypothetical protein
MVDRHTWKEFREIGLFWWINMILHTVGWSIILDVDDSGNVTDAYPARVKFRGFGEDQNTEGYIKVSEYLREHAEELAAESKE